jgi:glycosyltransferase involved in cell wall biosynthesis
MKILVIHNYYRYRGGEDVYVDSLIRLLKKKHYQIIFYTKDNRYLKNFFDKFKTTFNLFFGFWTKKELSFIIKKHKPDIAIVQNIYPQITPFVYRVCKNFKIPIIQRISNYRFFCPKGTLFRKGKICEICVKKLFKYPAVLYGCYNQSKLNSLIFTLAFLWHKLNGLFELIDKFVFPTDFIKDYFIKYKKIKEDKTIVIPTFTDINTKKPKINIKIKEKEFFLYVGRLSEEKGIIQLLEVFKTLPKIKLVVIGDGPLRRQLEGYKRYKNIIIKGFLPREEIYPYIKKANAVIISSIWYEVLPNVYLESIFQNTPVFIPDNENFRRIEENNNLVIRYKFGNFEDLKSKIKIFKKYSFKRLLVDLDKYSKINHLREIINLIKNSKRQK